MILYRQAIIHIINIIFYISDRDDDIYMQHICDILLSSDDRAVGRDRGLFFRAILRKQGGGKVEWWGSLPIPWGGMGVYVYCAIHALLLLCLFASPLSLSSQSNSYIVCKNCCAYSIKHALHGPAAKGENLLL